MGGVKKKNAGKTILKRLFNKTKPKVLAFSYQIRRSQRAKKTRIVVTEQKVEVVAPSKVSEQKIHDFVFSQQDWVNATIKKIQSRSQTVKSLAPSSYCDGVHVPYKGQQVTMRLKLSHLKRVKIEFTREMGFVVHVPGQLGDDHSELIRTALVNWMIKQALEAVRQYVDKHGVKHQLFPRTIKIKTQKSRWGSCGIHNDINMNWLLIIAPPEVMEYVVVHELCHIRHRNHSREFWQLVGDHVADYQKHRNWLKQHGQSLMLGL